MKQSTAPTESKVVTASWTAMATGLVTWGLVSFIPAWRAGIPQPLADFLPLVISAVSSTAAGYFTKHTPRQEEIMKAAFDILANPALVAEVETMIHQPAALPPSTETKSVG